MIPIAKLGIKKTFPFEVNGKVVKGKWKVNEILFYLFIKRFIHSRRPRRLYALRFEDRKHKPLAFFVTGVNLIRPAVEGGGIAVKGLLLQHPPPQ